MTGNRNTTFLVIDDNDFVRKSICDLLRRIGYNHVLESTEGREAVDILDTADRVVDIVMSDVRMPGMDGVELIRAIATRDHKPVFIPFSSSDVSVLDSVCRLAESRGLVVPGHLLKPVDEQKLLRMLEKTASASTSTAAHPPPTVLEKKTIKNAFKDDALRFHYQPKIFVADGSLAGYEALARWYTVDGDVLGPGAFMPVIEESDMANSMLGWSVERIVADRSATDITGRTSINLSARSLTDTALPDRLTEVFNQAGLQSNQFVLEITETGLMQDIADALDITTRLRLKGFELSIDDFGTGYSSLEQLARMPFHELKIDKSFIQDFTSSRKSRVIVESSTALAKKLEMRVVAEGVEHEAQWRHLSDLGVDMVQGFLFSPALPPHEIEDWQSKWKQRVDIAAYSK